MIAFLVFVILTLVVVWLMSVMMLLGVNFRQYMHQCNVEQGSHSDKENKTSPEVDGLSFRIISTDISGGTSALVVEDHKG